MKKLTLIFMVIGVIGITLLAMGSAKAAHILTEDVRLTAFDAAADDRFGGSVSIDGDTAVVGASFDDGVGVDSGSAYVFVRIGPGMWDFQEKLTAGLDAAAGDRFGDSVSVSGNTAVVGARHDDDACFPIDIDCDSGSAYVFVRSGFTWSQQGPKLTAMDGEAGDTFGISVFLSGDTVVIGAFHDDDDGSDSGSAYVFVRDDGMWTEEKKLIASDAMAGENFGFRVSIDDDTAVIGAIRANGASFRTGAAYVFVRHDDDSSDDDVWTEEAKLFASDGASFDFFGSSVSVNGETAVIGAFFGDVRDANGDVLVGNTGAAYVFVRDDDMWIEEAKLTASDAATGDQFGRSVSIDGDTALVGASFGDVRDANGDVVVANTGAVYVFVRDDDMWSEEAKLTAKDAAAIDFFGFSVSLSGDTALIGAFFNDDPFNSGSAYIFEDPEDDDEDSESEDDSDS